MSATNNNKANEPINGLFVDHFKAEGYNLGFMARDTPNYTDFENKVNAALYDLMIKRNQNKVEVLRPLWFFHEGQKDVTLGQLREYYTEKAIALFEKFEYVTIAENEKVEPIQNTEQS